MKNSLVFRHIGFNLYILSLCLVISTLFFFKTETKAAANLKQIDATSSGATISWTREAEEVTYEIYAWVPQIIEGNKSSEVIYEQTYMGSTQNTSFKMNGLVGGYDSKVLVRSYDEEDYFLKDEFIVVETLPGAMEIDKVFFKWGAYSEEKVTQGTNMKAYMYFNLYVDLLAQDKVDGYEVQVFNSKGKKIKTVKKKQNKSNIIRLAVNDLADTAYQVKARAYKEYNGKMTYGAWSTKRYALRQPRCQAKPAGGKLMIRWEKIANATGYDIYVSDKKKNDTFKKVKSVSGKTTLTTIDKISKKKKFKSGKTYYYYVLSKRKKGGEVVRSAKSFKLFKVKM